MVIVPSDKPSHYLFPSLGQSLLFPTMTKAPVFRICHRSLQNGLLLTALWIVMAILSGGWQLITDWPTGVPGAAWLTLLLLSVGAATWYTYERVTVTPWQIEIICQGFWKRAYVSPLEQIFINKQWVLAPASPASEASATLRFDVGAPWETDTEFVYTYFQGEKQLQELDLQLSLAEYADLVVACQQMAAWRYGPGVPLASPTHA